MPLAAWISPLCRLYAERLGFISWHVVGTLTCLEAVLEVTLFPVWPHWKLASKNNTILQGSINNHTLLSVLKWRCCRVLDRWLIQCFWNRMSKSKLNKMMSSTFKTRFYYTGEWVNSSIWLYLFSCLCLGFSSTSEIQNSKKKLASWLLWNALITFSIKLSQQNLTKKNWTLFSIVYWPCRRHSGCIKAPSLLSFSIEHGSLFYLFTYHQPRF